MGEQIAEYVRLLEGVAHAAWHLMEESGETTSSAVFTHLAVDHVELDKRLSDLEASGWQVHNDRSERS